MTHNNTATTELDCNAIKQATAFVKPEGIGRTYRVTLYFYPVRNGRTRLKGFWGHTGRDFDSQPINVLGGSGFQDAWQRVAAQNKAIKGFMADNADLLLELGFIDQRGNWSKYKSSKGDIMNALEVCGYKTDCTNVYVNATECCVCIANKIND